MVPKEQHAGEAKDARDAPAVVSPMTEYVVTRWYRPPELMLAPNGCYDGAVDMWSVGCILGELIVRKPMFPGTDFMDQLTRVFKVVSIPESDLRGYVIEKDALKFLQSLPPTQADAMEKMFKNAPPGALDLIKRLLCFNPKERLTADEALAHPFFNGIKEEWGDIAPLHLDRSLEFAFENKSLPLATLRQYICEEVLAFRNKEAQRKHSGDKIPSESDAAKPQEKLAQTQPTRKEAAKLELVNDVPAGHGFTLKGCDFNVPSRYKPLHVLGEGSYGIVTYVLDVFDGLCAGYVAD